MGGLVRVRVPSISARLECKHPGAALSSIPRSRRRPSDVFAEVTTTSPKRQRCTCNKMSLGLTPLTFHQVLVSYLCRGIARWRGEMRLALVAAFLTPLTAIQPPQCRLRRPASSLLGRNHRADVLCSLANLLPSTFQHLFRIATDARHIASLDFSIFLTLP